MLNVRLWDRELYRGWGAQGAGLDLPDSHFPRPLHVGAIAHHSLNVCVFSKSYVGTKSSMGEAGDMDPLGSDLVRRMEPSEMGSWPYKDAGQLAVRGRSWL